MQSPHGLHNNVMESKASPKHMIWPRLVLKYPSSNMEPPLIRGVSMPVILCGYILISIHLKKKSGLRYQIDQFAQLAPLQ
eukprot:SAG31_NODE_2178_length_6250_cov_2.498456_4_plen_80_part_00